MDVVDKMYRYEDVKESFGCDEFDDVLPGHSTHVYLRTYRVTKRTPSGVWIDNYGKRKFVLLRGKKRFAHPTPEEALKSFIYRKEVQEAILTAQLNHVKRAIIIGKKKAEDEKVSTSGVVA